MPDIAHEQPKFPLADGHEQAGRCNSNSCRVTLRRVGGMMRISVAVALGVLLAFQTTRPAASNEAAIKSVVAQYLAAREHRDAAAVGALFTDDADQLTSSGEWRRGRDAIVRGTLQSSERTGGTRRIAIETVRFPAPSVAIADGRYELTSAQEGRRAMWTSFVLVRSGDRWRISAIRNMLPAAAPAAR
jgi:uncharacterized protein (TIGR02246 family)